MSLWCLTSSQFEQSQIYQSPSSQSALFGANVRNLFPYPMVIMVSSYDALYKMGHFFFFFLPVIFKSLIQPKIIYSVKHRSNFIFPTQ